MYDAAAAIRRRTLREPLHRINMGNTEASVIMSGVLILHSDVGQAGYGMDYSRTPAAINAHRNEVPARTWLDGVSYAMCSSRVAWHSARVADLFSVVLWYGRR